MLWVETESLVAAYDVASRGTGRRAILFSQIYENTTTSAHNSDLKDVASDVNLQRLRSSGRQL